jgi:hypothetical protein
MAEVRPARFSAPSYHLEGDELIIQNTKRKEVGAMWQGVAGWAAPR